MKHQQDAKSHTAKMMRGRFGENKGENTTEMSKMAAKKTKPHKKKAKRKEKEEAEEAEGEE